MRLFLGTDICEIQRIEDIYKKYGQAFLKKIYTLREINYCLSNEKMAIPRLAARFAAKEAVSTIPCEVKCNDCGVCRNLKTRKMLSKLPILHGEHKMHRKPNEYVGGRSDVQPMRCMEEVEEEKKKCNTI